MIAKHSNKVDLLPCPFCGGEAHMHREALDERFGYAEKVTVACHACRTSKSAVGDTSKPGYADNSTVEARAIEQWNRRAAPAPTLVASATFAALPPPLPTMGYIPPPRRLTADQREAHEEAEADRYEELYAEIEAAERDEHDREFGPRVPFKPSPARVHRKVIARMEGERIEQ